jgi:hypothetical protein
VTAERCEIGLQPSQIKNGVDPAQQMIIWNTLLEIELAEWSILSTSGWPHHRHCPTPDDLESKNHAATILSTESFNTLSQIRTVVS